MTSNYNIYWSLILIKNWFENLQFTLSALNDRRSVVERLYLNLRLSFIHKLNEYAASTRNILYVEGWQDSSMVERFSKDWKVCGSSLCHGILLWRWALHLHLASAARISINWGPTKCTAETNNIASTTLHLQFYILTNKSAVYVCSSYSKRVFEILFRFSFFVPAFSFYDILCLKTFFFSLSPRFLINNSDDADSSVKAF